MKIKTIEYDEDELPETVTVRMSVAEAAFLSKTVGKQTHAAAEEIMADGGTHSSNIYNAMCLIFNTHWFSGIDGYLRGDKE